jgi:hypothetical protein
VCSISRECISVVICMNDPEMLALSSPTSGGRSVGIVRSRTQATELVLVGYFGRGSSEVLRAVLVKFFVRVF